MEALPERFGKYHVLERLARGGMAEVYRVKTVGIAGFEKIQALKRILPELASQPRFIRSFIDEARIAVELNHRNIVQVFDFGRAGGELYLAMELIDGLDLRTAIRDAAAQRARLPMKLACYVLREVATGLDYAHRRSDVSGRPLNIVHCDVSPQNIMLSHEGFVKILDFGVARARIGSTPDGRRLRGKPRYMAPEQTRGKEPSAATDVFSLGIVSWELLAGVPLFDGRDVPAILAAVRRAEVPALAELNPDVPEELAAAVHRALSPHPAGRGTAAELAAALADAGRALGVASARELAAWLRDVYPASESPAAPADAASVTLLEVPVPAAGSKPEDPEVTHNTATFTHMLEEIDGDGPLQAMTDRRRVAAVVVIVEGSSSSSRRSLARVLGDLAYKRGAVLDSEEDDTLTAVFGLEVAGEDNVSRAMGYALDAVEAARAATGVTDGELAVRIAARAGVVAQRHTGGYRLMGDAVAETAALAREAEPNRPLLCGIAGRLTAAAYAFRERPARRHRRRGLRVLELVGPRSFDERDRALRERRGRFIGRKQALERLGAELSRAIDEDRRVVVVVSGRPGVGKSRLVAEFVARTSAPSTRSALVAVVATPASQVAPFATVIELFQSALDLPPGRGVAARGQLNRRLRHVLERSGELGRDVVDDTVAAVELAMELRDGQLIGGASARLDLREQMVAALRTFRSVLIRRQRSLVTVIEDIHYIDGASLDVLRNITRPPAARGAELLLLTGRTHAERILSAVELDHRLDLDELGDGDRLALIRDRLGEAATEDAVLAVARRAGGNPFFIEELAEAVRERGPTEIPSNAREVVLSRIDRLPAPMKAALQYAAVLGPSFRARILEELVGADVHAEIEDLCDEGLLARADGASMEAHEGELVFTHGLIQEVIYESLGAAARRETHARLGRLLASRYQAGREEPPAVIADHLERGGEGAAAAAYWLRAGRLALAAFDAQAAVQCFSRTLDQEIDREIEGEHTAPAARARRREALAGRERAHHQLGDHQAQAADLDALLRLAGGDPRRIAAVKNRSAVRHLRLGDYAAAARDSQEAEQAARDGGDERARGEALRLRAEAFERQGQFDRALDAVGRALEIFRRIGAVNDETNAMIGRGRILLVRANYEAALEAYSPVLERIRTGGDPWLERIVSNHMAVAHMCLGNFTRAYNAAQRSVHICRRYGDRAREGDNLSVSGIILSEVGRFEEAEQLFGRALAIHAETGSRWSRADCLVYAGANDVHRGHTDRGIERIGEALALARDIGARYIEANAQVSLASALLRRDREGDVELALDVAREAVITARAATLVGPELQALSRQAEATWRAGDRVRALELSTEAMALLDRQRYVEGSEEEVVFLHYQLLRESGDEGAAEVLARAASGYRRKLDSLGVSEWRRSFERLPLHRAIERAAAG